jgi:two-component system, sensor histidine kinase LadS
MNTLKLFLLSFSCFFNTLLRAQPIVNYHNPNELLEMGPFVSYYVDTTAKLSYRDIDQLPSSQFKIGKGGMINLGFSKYPIWLRFQISNRTNKSLYAYLEAQEIDFVDVLVVGEDSTYHLETGAWRPYGKRQFNINSVVIPLGKDPSYLYISVTDINRLVFPLKIGAVGPLVEKVYRESMINAFVTGVLLMIVILSFFIYLILKDLTFLIFSIHVGFSILTMLVFEGYLFEMVWRDMPYMNNSVNSNLVRLFTLLSSMSFSVYFLDLRKESQVIVHAYKILAVLAFLTVPARIAGFEQAEKWFNLIVVIIFASYLATGLVSYRKGFKPARFYLLGWSIYIFEIILLMLTSFDVLSFDHFYTYYGYQIGTVFLAFFLTLALNDRINNLRNEFQHAQSLALRYLAENKQIIEKQNELRKSQLEHPEKGENQELIALLKSIKAEKGRTPRISIATLEGTILCSVNNIVHIEAEGSYATIHLENGQKILASRTLSTFEKQLADFPDFVKIHKSSMINIEFVVRYHKGDGGHVSLRNGTEVAVSRAAKNELLHKLGLHVQ